MSTTSKQYRFTSDVGKFNASALLATHEAGEKVEEDKVLKRVAEESYAMFHVKSVLYEDDGTSKNALGRVRRDLQRLKGNKWVVQRIESGDIKLSCRTCDCGRGKDREQCEKDRCER